MSFLMQIRLSLVALIFSAVYPAAAHHSAKIFENTVIALPGTVTRYGWTNPHTYIYVETLDQNGEAVEWEIETDAIPILVRSGWGPDSFAPGDEVLVRARPDRNRDRRHALLVSAESLSI